MLVNLPYHKNSPPLRHSNRTVRIGPETGISATCYENQSWSCPERVAVRTRPGLTQLQSRKNIRGNMEQRKQWLRIKSKVSRLRTHAAAFDMLTLFPVYLMGKPQNGIASLRK
ncbi:hypothetical protein TNCT_734201 [Trichonephila clavata]|uniref:Uncharacterized protein n=1 Tax=Trichonephila clavata TaxID=2740835 RepID=A0A8X6J2A9_TRICU|nr:hypothetical protein TNCT_734201 [Trichonephila clavata]